jgi:large subunit ribosomal protein L24
MQATKNPGKQRKILFNAPAHKRHKLMGAPLSSELLAQKGVKTLPVRKGDTVRILRGDHKGFEGKVSRVDLKHYRVYIEGLTREKVDGTTVFVALHPSKILIKTLNLDDKVRKAVLARKKPIIKKAKKPQKKVEAEAAKTPAAEKVTEEKLVEEAAPAEEQTISEELPEEKTTTKVTVPKKLPTAKKPKEEIAEEEPKTAAKHKTTPKTEGGT